jgi:hypothetical protein
VPGGEGEQAAQPSGERVLGQWRFGAGGELGEAEVGVREPQPARLGERRGDLDPGPLQRREGLRHRRSRAGGRDEGPGVVR